MKRIYLILALAFFVVENQFGQGLYKLNWDRIVLRNYAVFKNRDDLDWGSAFLMNTNNGVIACTSRSFTGTPYTPGKMLSLKDFEQELIWWKFYLPDYPSKYIVVDSLVLKERIERRFSIFVYSRPFLSFSLKNTDSNIIPLNPSVRRINNGDTLFLAGLDNENKVKIARGVVETSLNEKYADYEIRLKTEEYLDFDGFVGSPVLDDEGNVVGVFNRAYYLKKNKKGKIINDDKIVSESHFEYFVDAAAMRNILGKNYGN